MAFRKVLYLFTLLISSPLTIAQAGSERDLIVQQELNCVDAHLLQTTAISWNDICDVPQSPGVDRHQVIDDALNTAENILDPTEPQKNPSKQKYKFELAFQGESYNLQTANNWPYYYTKFFDFPVSNKVAKSGFLYGLYGSSTWNGPLYSWNESWKDIVVPNFAKFEVETSKGTSNYSSYVTGKLDGFKPWYIEGRATIGNDYRWDQRTDFTPYTGVGYLRFTNNDGGWEDFSILNHVQYKTVTGVGYIPIGVETHTTLNEQWDLNVKLEGDIVVFGSVDDHLNEIPGVFASTDLKTGLPVELHLKENTSTLKGGFGYRTSFKLVRKFKYCNLFIEPFFKILYLNKTKEESEYALGTNGINYYSAYRNGAAYTPIWDPKDYTLEIGTRLGVQF